MLPSSLNHRSKDGHCFDTPPDHNAFSLPKQRVQTTGWPQLLLLLATTILAGGTGCAHRTIHASGTAAPAPSDNSYMDLEPGWKLRILVPLTNAEGASGQAGALREEHGSTITLSAGGIVGYEISYYSVVGRRNGNVQLKFLSATKTINGETMQEPKPPPLPFPLPRSAERIRLSYYVVRSNQADHKMALLASKRLDLLNRFTTRLNENPSTCNVSAADPVFCSWVPAGVAVRPEKE